MAIPALLGLLGMVGGALGQDWYFADEAKKGQEKLRGLLGSAPEAVPDGGYSNPTPGSGLMADPANIQRQLEFAAGVMGLNPRQQAQAHALVEPILGRANTQLGWERQAQENAIGRAQADRHFEGHKAQVEDHFGQTMVFNREKFEEDKVQFGETKALELKRHRDSMAMQGAQLALAKAAEQRQALESSLRVQSLLNPQPTMGAGWERVRVPSLAPGVMGPDVGTVVGRPVKGTEPWQRAQGEVREVVTAIGKIDAMLQSLEDEGGTKQFGGGSGTQAILYGDIISAMGKRRSLGTLQPGDMANLQGQLPNPTEILTKPIGMDFLRASLNQLKRGWVSELGMQEEAYRGWQLEIPTYREAVKAQTGREAPPPGSTAFDSGPASGTRRGRGPYR